MLPLIKLNKVSRYYQNKKTIIKSLENINFEICSGEILSILGPSGCGKTTLLKIIANIIEPSSGQIYYKNEHISCAREKGLIGIVPQSPTLLPNRTVLSNINLPLEIKKFREEERLKNLINLVGLNGFESLYPHQLSGGMRQKVAIARALIYQPEVLLMDEPFSSLDEILREKLNLELLEIFSALNQTVVFVTHNIEEAVFISNRIIIMSNNPGKIVDIVEINLPRQRTLELKNEHIFFKETIKVRKLIKEGYVK